MKCVVLCAGKGTRMESDIPKVLIPINGKPLVQHVIDMWNIVDEFIFVVGYRWKEVVKYLSKDSKYIIQKEQRGIADAILKVEGLVNDKFIVALGDCIQKGTWQIPLEESLQFGVGVWKTTNISEVNKNYLVKVSDKKLITKVIEKPKLTYAVWDALCGMGTYFFDKRIFDYIRKTPKSSLRNEIEITDTIQLMINSRERVSPFFFIGRYLNITYPEDIKEAEELLNE